MRTVSSRTYTIFIEYRVQEEKWGEFTQSIPHLQEATQELGRSRRHSFLAGRAQPYVIVEMIEGTDEQGMQQICHRRQTRTDAIYPLYLPWMDEEKTLQIWVFEPIASF
jgi:hypothetical protein